MPHDPNVLPGDLPGDGAAGIRTLILAAVGYERCFDQCLFG
jgi:hypothetical protein